MNLRQKTLQTNLAQHGVQVSDEVAAKIQPWLIDNLNRRLSHLRNTKHSLMAELKRHEQVISRSLALKQRNAKIKNLRSTGVGIKTLCERFNLTRQSIHLILKKN